MKPIAVQAKADVAAFPIQDIGLCLTAIIQFCQCHQSHVPPHIEHRQVRIFYLLNVERFCIL